MPAPETCAAFAAAAMLAISPITGDCQARTLSLCTGDGAVHTLLVWDQDTAPQPRQPASPGKACHACVLDKRKMRDSELGDDSA